MPIPNATPIPFPTFQKGPGEEGRPAHLLEFILDVQKQFDSENWDDPLRIPSWRLIMRAICDNVLPVLPSPQLQIWEANHESIKLTDTCLKFIAYVGSKPQGASIFCSGNSAQIIFARLLRIRSILEEWAEQPIPSTHEYSNPSEMQSRATSACLVILRALGGSTVLDLTQSSIASWEAVRAILNESLGMCEGKCHNISSVTISI